MSYSIQKPTPYSVWARSQNGSAVYTNQTRYGTLLDSKTGTKVDQWKSKIRDGLPTGSPYSRDVMKCSFGTPLRDILTIVPNTGPKVLVIQKAEGYPCENLDIGCSHNSVSMTTATSKALSKIYTKLESERSEWNAPQFLAEVMDVVRQFGAPFESMTKAIHKHYDRLILERRRLTGGPLSWRKTKWSEIVASTWLETAFGLMPLISDTRSAAEALGRFKYEVSDSPKLRDRIVSRATEKNFTQFTQDYLANGTFLRYRVTYDTKTEARSQYSVGLKGEIRADFGSNDRLLELLGLEPRNIPLAIWEGTPWSWLVDYFTNVGNILQAGATLTTRVNWICLSETKRTVITTSPKLTLPVSTKPYYDVVNLESQPPTIRGIPVGGLQLVRTTLNRTIPTTLGIPAFYLHTPFGSVKRMLNLAAIVVQRGKKEDSKLWLF